MIRISDVYYPERGELPDEREYVLGYFPYPHIHEYQPDRWFVVQIYKGISEREREALADTNRRKREIHFGDEEGNNQKPYQWRACGPMQFFGQECTMWFRIIPTTYLKEKIK